MDRRCLRRAVRRADARVGQPRRPSRPQAHVPRRLGCIRGLLDVGRAFRLGRDARRGPCEHGHRSRAHHALHAGDHHQHLHRDARAAARDRPLGGDKRGRDRTRPDRRRIALGALLVGLGVPDQRADRRGRFCLRASIRPGLAESVGVSPRPGRVAPLDSRAGTAPRRDHRGARARLVVAARAGHRHRWMRNHHCLCHLGADSRASDAQPTVLPREEFLRRDRVGWPDDVRRARRLLRSHTVPPVPDWLLAVAGRGAHAPRRRRDRPGRPALQRTCAARSARS